jgi:hypothetical protein
VSWLYDQKDPREEETTVFCVDNHLLNCVFDSVEDKIDIHLGVSTVTCGSEDKLNLLKGFWFPTITEME